MSQEDNNQTTDADGVEVATERHDQSAGRDVSDTDRDADDEGQEPDADQRDDWQQDFDPNRALEKIRKQNSELRRLRERAKTAEQKAEGVEDKDARISELSTAALRYEVALDLGLPKELAKRLTGTTKEEMYADAEELVKLVNGKRSPTQQPRVALRPAGVEVEPVETDLSKVGARMFKR